MAKLKNRAKRKKVQIRKRNQQDAIRQKEEGIYPLVFDGYMMVPLDTSLEPERIRELSTYTEDWAVMRRRIFSSARRYRVTAHLFRDGVLGKAVATSYIKHKVEEHEIIGAAQESFEEARDEFEDIDMKQVYLCIRA